MVALHSAKQNVSQDTGIKVTDQYSKYRAQWGDALQ
jgi:hypothetical protein